MANYGAFGYGGTGGPFAQEEYGTYNPKYHYQAGVNAGFEMAASDQNPRTLYVGNLDASVTEEFIATLFGQIGMVTKTKIIYDVMAEPYAFVEFGDHYTASQALQAMNKRFLLDKEMKVNWATRPGAVHKVDTSKHFHVFVGDLSPEVDNKTLTEAFAPFGSISDAKVIRDPVTLKSKGYGFVSYPKRDEAERAIEQMNGQWLGRRTIRTNWATRKPASLGGSGLEYYTHKTSYEEIYNQTGPENTSVYIGNAPAGCSEEDIKRVFGKYGKITDIRHFKPQGYAFVKYDTKDAACKAIYEMNGGEMMGTTVRCSWGKVEGLPGTTAAPGVGRGAGIFNGPAVGAGAAAGPGRGGGTGGADSSVDAATLAAQQQYWSYYQQYYNNPQMQQQWANYYQQQGNQ